MTTTILDVPEIRARVFRWTVEQYEKLEDDPAFRHYELIRGCIIDKMSKSPQHATITTRLYAWLLKNLAPEFVARQEQPLRLRDSMPEPDVSVMRGRLEDFARRHPSTAVLVVEVAVSSAVADRENAALYAEAGVHEYWIVLAEAEQVEVYRRPAAGVYTEVRTYGRGEMVEGVEVLGGEAFPVEALFI